MNVLFLSSWFPNRTAPYNGDFVERHALAVSEVCTTSVIHVVSDENPSCPRIEITEKHKGKLLILIIYFRRHSGPFKLLSRMLNYLCYVYGYAKGYGRIKKMHGKPEIIHANVVFPAAIIAMIMSGLMRIPYIISEHWTVFLTSERIKTYFSWILHRAAKKAFALVPVTVNLKEAMIRHGFRGNYRIVPNVVDTSLFSLKSEEPHLTRRIVHVSSMKETQKNISGIMRVLHRLKEIRSDFVFTFAGEAQPYQKQLAETLGLLPGHIVFKGMISNAEVAELMRESDFLVMFSSFENLPCVILEAFSCGLPVISSDTGGIKEWVNETNGLLVKPNDEDELLKAILIMLDNYDHYNPQMLRNYSVKNFGNERIANQFKEIYLEALNNRKDA